MGEFKTRDYVIIQRKRSRYTVDVIAGFENGFLFENKVARIRILDNSTHRAFITYNNINDKCVEGWWVGVDVLVKKQTRQELPNWF
jgi:hypothetical protein